jgi:hypothetical protein
MYPIPNSWGWIWPCKFQRPITKKVPVNYFFEQILLKWIRAKIFSKMDFQDFFYSAHFLLSNVHQHFSALGLFTDLSLMAIDRSAHRFLGYLAYRLPDIGLPKAMSVRVSHRTFLHEICIEILSFEEKFYNLFHMKCCYFWQNFVILSKISSFAFFNFVL